MRRGRLVNSEYLEQRYHLVAKGCETIVILKNAGTKSRILGKELTSLALAELKGEMKMAEYPDDLKKLVVVATDLGLAAELRTKAVKLIGNIGTHEALLALLNLVANEQLTKGEKELALKHAREIVKSGH